MSKRARNLVQAGKHLFEKKHRKVTPQNFKVAKRRSQRKTTPIVVVLGNDDDEVEEIDDSDENYVATPSPPSQTRKRGQPPDVYSTQLTLPGIFSGAKPINENWRYQLNPVKTYAKKKKTNNNRSSFNRNRYGLNGSGTLGATRRSSASSSSHRQSTLSFESTQRKGRPRLSGGMVNLGNTCYMNAAIQALLSLRRFTSEITDEMLKAMMQSIGASAEHSMYFAMEKLARCHARNEPVDPKPIKSAIGKYNARFGGFSQEDAHEVLRDILSGIEEELEASLKDTQEPGWLTPVADCFSFTVVDSLTCSTCGVGKTLKEVYYDLSLDFEDDVNEGDFHDIQHMVLSRFSALEQVQRTCDSPECTAEYESAAVEALAMDEDPPPKEGIAAVFHRFHSLPWVLCLHLKRFMLVELEEGFQYLKNSAPVCLSDAIDLRPAIDEAKRDEFPISQYLLRSIVIHSGVSMRSGHYYTFTLMDDGTWRKFNDSRVTKVSKETVFSTFTSENCYILMYEYAGGRVRDNTTPSRKDGDAALSPPAAVPESASLSDAVGVDCPRCTFHNQSNAIQCEICQSSLTL